MKKTLLLSAAMCMSLFAAAQTTEFNNGYFTINEGQYGNEPGLLNFVDAETGEVQTKVYQTASGNTLGMTAQFGTLADGKLFICSKQNFGDGGRLVVADAKTLQTLASYKQIDGDADTRGIGVVVSAGKFFVGTNKGVYAYDLQTLQPLGLVEGSAVEGGTYSPGSGDMVVSGGKLYVAVPDGVMVIDPATQSVVTTVEIASTVSVFTVDDEVYAAVNSCTWGTPGANDTEQFVLINDDNTVGTTYTVPMASPNSWFTPKPVAPAQIPGTRAIVYGAGEGSKNICKYDFDTQTFTKEFITYDGRQQNYGNVVTTDPKTGDILACTFQSYSSTNDWFNIYDSATGEVKTSIKMPAHMWFTSQIVKALDKDQATGIDGLTASANEVVSVTYCDLAGRMSSKPFSGVNIVVTRYASGATATNRVVF